MIEIKEAKFNFIIKYSSIKCDMYEPSKKNKKKKTQKLDLLFSEFNFINLKQSLVH